MRLPIVFKSENLPEWTLMELQGSLTFDAPVEQSADETPGDETRCFGTVQSNAGERQRVLTLSQYELAGNIVTLKQPFLVLRKRKPVAEHGTTQWECVAIIREKTVFRDRPRPRVPTELLNLKQKRSR
jgi:hypothetical protein